MPHTFTDWVDTPDALAAAIRWALDGGNVLDAYLATRQSDDDYKAWLDDLEADHADRQQEERRDRPIHFPAWNGREW